jgi:hypothetical protein
MYAKERIEAKARAACPRYFVEEMYNHKRLHSAHSYLPPFEFELKHNQAPDYVLTNPS